MKKKAVYDTISLKYRQIAVRTESNGMFELKDGRGNDNTHKNTIIRIDGFCRFVEFAQAFEIGKIKLASDNFENNALDMAKCFLHYGKYEEKEEVFRRIDNLTST